MLSSDSEDDCCAENEPQYMEIHGRISVADSKGFVPRSKQSNATFAGSSKGENMYMNYDEIFEKQLNSAKEPPRRTNRELIRKKSSFCNAYSIISQEASRHERYSIHVLLTRCAVMPFNAIRQTDGAEKMERVLTVAHFEHIRSRFVTLLRGEFIMRKGDKILAELLQTFFDECLRNYHVLKMVRIGGITLSDLRDIFATRVDKEIQRMGFREVSLADQVKQRYMDILNRLLDENMSTKKTIKGSNFKKDHMLTEIRLMLKIRNQIHNRLCQLMLLDRPMKLQGLVEAELKERFQVEHEAAVFNMPLNWYDQEKGAEIERELENQTRELMQNFRCYVTSMEDKNAEEQENEANKYISQINYRMRKTRVWVEDRTFLLGGTSNDADTSIGSSLPEIVITVTIDNVRNLGLHFRKSTCIMIVTMNRIGKKGQKKRFKMEKTDDPSILEGVNEEATFQFGGPLPQIELALCSYRKEGPIGKSFAMIHTVGKTTFQLYPDKIEAHVNEVKDKQIVYQMGTKRDITFNPKKKSLPPFTASVSISMAIPDNVKCTGELYFMSKELTNEKWKKRYAILMETSRSNFVLSFYKPMAGEPADIIPLDRFVVDYLDFQETATSDVVQYPKIADLPEGVDSSGMFYFYGSRGGKFRIEMATGSSDARDVWLEKLAVATRQTFKPEPPVNLDSSQLDEDDLNIAELEEYSRLSYLNPEVDTHELYTILIKIFLNFKLADDYRSLGWFTAEQRLMIDEFCSRYAIRSTEKHFVYLKTLVKKAVEGEMIDPSLLHYAFVCTSSSFNGIKLPGMATSSTSDFLGFFTSDEFDCFYPEVKLNIAALVKGPIKKVPVDDIETAIEETLIHVLVSFLLNKISTFTTSYPFGKPQGLIESCFAFLERIMEETNPLDVTKVSDQPYADLIVSRAHVENGQKNGNKKSSMSEEMMSPVVRMMVEKCMTKAAIKDYKNLMGNSQDITQNMNRAGLDIPFLIGELKQFLSIMISHLQTTELYFHQSFSSFPEFLKLYLDTLCYLMFSRLNDFFQLLPIDSWEVFEIHQILNTYFTESKLMMDCSFHKELCGLIVPTVIQYMALTEKSITESFNKNMAKEQWVSEGASCLTSEDVFWKLFALRNFIHDLRWPQDEFNQHLNFRLMILAANSIDSVVKLAIKTFHSTISSVPKNRKGLLYPKLGVLFNVLTRADEVIGNLRLNQILNKLMKEMPPTKQYKKLKVANFVGQGLETFLILIHQIFDGALNEQLDEISKFDVKTTFIYSIYSFTLNLKSKVTNSVGSKKDEDLPDGNKAKAKEKQKHQQEQQKMLSITETAPLWLTKWLTTDPDVQTDEYDISTPYIDFVRNNIAAIRENVKNDVLIEEIFADWYHSIVDQLLDYVNKRMSVQLNVVQINSINSLLKRVYRAFLMENMKIGDMESDNLKLLRARLESEERGAIRIGKGDLVKEFSGDSDEEDEENIRKIEHMLR